MRHSDDGSRRLKPLWRKTLTLSPAAMAAPVAAGDRLLVSVESPDRMEGGVICLDRVTGEALWEAELSGMVKGSPAISGDAVVAVTITGTIVRLDLNDGEVHWRRQLPNPLERWIYHDACIVEDGVVAGSSVRLVRLDLVTGEIVWEQAGFGGTDWICSRIAPVYGEGRLFMGFFGARTGLVAFRFSDGRELWRHEAAWGASSPSGTPLYDQGRLYLARNTGKFQCLDPATGEANWETELGERWCPAKPLAIEGVIVATTSTGRVMGADQASGDVLWEWKAPEGEVSVVPYRRTYGGHVAGPIERSGQLLIAGLDGSLTQLDPRTGREVRRWPLHTLGGAPVTAPLAVSGDVLVAANLAREVAAWKIET